MAALPPQPLKKKVQYVYELICQKKVRVAEIDLSKLLKKHKDLPVVKALGIWLNVVQQKNTDVMEELKQFLKAMKTMEEDEQVPIIIASAYKALGQSDKAAEAFGIFAERFGRAIYYTQYLDFLVKAFKFDEQAKVALKMYQIEKSLVNKHRLSVATFLQAAAKKTPEERERSFDYAIKLAERIYDGENEKEHANYYKKTVENLKDEFNQHRLIITADKTVMAQWKYPTGFEALNRILSKVPEYEMNKEILTKKECPTLDERKKAFNIALKNLKGSYRQLAHWDDAYQKMLSVFQLDPECGVYEEFAVLFQDLLEKDRKRQLEQDALLACIRFLQVANWDYSIGSVVGRIIEYVERFGHQIDTIHHIIPIFNDLEKQDKQTIINHNDKIISIFHKYVSDFDEYFRDNTKPNILLKDSFSMTSEDLATLNCTFVPSLLGDALIAYYGRMLLSDLMRNSCNSDIPLKCEELEKSVNKWNKVANILANCCVSGGQADSLITQIIRVCADGLWKLYSRFHNAVYLELLICFLFKQRKRSPTPNQVIQLLLLNACLELGYAQMALKLYDEMDIRALQIESMGFLCDFALENVGRFDDAYKFYETMSTHYREFMMETEDALLVPYREGRIKQALQLVTKIVENMNSVQRAVQYSRRRFLDAILYSKSTSDLRDFLLRDGGPVEHPYDHRDFHLFLQNLPVQEPLYSAFKQSRSYCLCIAEISVIRILCGVLSLFVRFEDGEKITNYLESQQSELDCNYGLITAGYAAKKEELKYEDDMAISVSNSLNSRVVAPFIGLVKLFCKHSAIIVGQKYPNVETIVSSLPTLDDYRTFFDQASAVLNGAFREKNNYGVRIEALAAAVKMLNYLSQLIALIYSAIGHCVKINAETFKTNKKFKPIYERFRLYAIEMKLLMNLVNSLCEKFNKRLLVIQNFYKDVPSSKVTLTSMTEFSEKRHADFQLSLSSIRKYQSFSSLTRFGLLKGG